MKFMLIMLLVLLAPALVELFRAFISLQWVKFKYYKRQQIWDKIVSEDTYEKRCKQIADLEKKHWIIFK